MGASRIQAATTLGVAHDVAMDGTHSLATACVWHMPVGSEAMFEIEAGHSLASFALPEQSGKDRPN
jgi:hypothetical protein